MVYSNIDLCSISSICSLICDYMKTSEFIEIQNRYIALGVPLEESIYNIMLDPSITKMTGIYNIEFCCLEFMSCACTESRYYIDYNFRFNLNVSSYFFKRDLIDFTNSSNVYYQITVVEMNTTIKSLYLELVDSKTCKIVLALNKNNYFNHLTISMHSYIPIYDIDNRISSNLELDAEYNESFLIYKNCRLNIDDISRLLNHIKYAEIDNFIANNNVIFTSKILLHVDSDIVNILHKFFSLKKVFIKYEKIYKKLVVPINNERDVIYFINLVSSFNRDYGFNQFEDFHLKVVINYTIYMTMEHSLYTELTEVQKLFLDCYVC